MARFWASCKTRLPGWFLTLSVIADMALLMVLIWSFHRTYQQPPSFYLKAPTLLYVFIFIALRFDAHYVLRARQMLFTAVSEGSAKRDPSRFFDRYVADRGALEIIEPDAVNPKSGLLRAPEPSSLTLGRQSGLGGRVCRECLIPMALAMPTSSDVPDSAWGALVGELDAWADAGLTATFWWRDDDAADHGPALDQLLALRAAIDVPLALAVIPATATDALRDRLADEAAVSVLQHGYSHKDFNAGEGRKIELDDSRPAEYVVADLAMGGQAMEKFARRLPILVPPWNRIAPHLVPFLPELGIQGLSTFGARTRVTFTGGMRLNNVHADVIDWCGKRTGVASGFLGAEIIIGDILDHLTTRRTGEDALEATGLMTHHADMDDPMFDFVTEFVNRTKAHPAVVWQSASEVFSIS
ncbi:MAG: polysaccharide deacetylase family protein [Alphaproteobacteria bacterium]